MALETAKGTGVTCNAICPGYMFTALVQNQLEDTARIRGISKVSHTSAPWRFCKHIGQVLASVCDLHHLRQAQQHICSLCIARDTHIALQEEVVEKVLLADQPSKEFVSVDDVGQFAVFLCSDAARQMTGACLSMDGGWTAR